MASVMMHFQNAPENFIELDVHYKFDHISTNKIDPIGSFEIFSHCVKQDKAYFRVSFCVFVIYL